MKIKTITLMAIPVIIAASGCNSQYSVENENIALIENADEGEGRSSFSGRSSTIATLQESEEINSMNLENGSRSSGRTKAMEEVLDSNIITQ